jgi:MFS transporter, DHA2 family, methylenomycin A resistance protein
MQAASEMPREPAPIHSGPGNKSTLRQRLTLLAVCIAQGMILLDVTIVNIALPSIQRELHASSSELEWVISAYALSLAALIPLSGTLGDRFGRKRLFAAGMAVFMLGSVACALSASAPDLIAARAFQGVGGALMSALALSILSQAYPGTTRAGAIGIWATVAGLGFGLGPVVGGLLLAVSGWSSIFWVNVPFAVAGIALTITVVPESRNPDTRPVDVPGVLTSAAGLLALTFGLIESSSNSWRSAPVGASLAAGVVLLAWFAWREHRAPFPMIPPAVIKLRSFTTSCGVYLLSYAALTGVYFYLTLLYQDVDGWTALRTGLSWLFMNIPFLVMARFAGRLSRRLAARTRHPETLTHGETRVLRYLPTNLTAREIAGELCLSVNTVKTHQRHLYQKLGAHSRTQAVGQARALGLLASFPR